MSIITLIMRSFCIYLNKNRLDLITILLTCSEKLDTYETQAVQQIIRLKSLTYKTIRGDLEILKGNRISPIFLLGKSNTNSIVYKSLVRNTNHRIPWTALGEAVTPRCTKIPTIKYLFIVDKNDKLLFSKRSVIFAFVDKLNKDVIFDGNNRKL